MRFAGFDVPEPYSRPAVVVLGDVLVDHAYQVTAMPAVGGDAVATGAKRHPGGAGLNTAVGLAGLGIKTMLAGTVGDDDEGRFLRNVLGERGVGTGLLGLPRGGGGTGHVISFADSRGERTMFSYRGCAGDPLELTDEHLAALDLAPLLFVSGYGLQDAPQAASYLAAVRRVKKSGGKVAFDPTPVVRTLSPGAIDEMLDLTDFLLPNETELLALAGSDDLKDVVALLTKRVPCLGIKLGGQGSIIVAKAQGLEVTQCPALEVPVVDTTGAGDAFNAGFLAAHLYGLPAKSWGEWGNRLAARVVGRQGASL